LPYPPSPILSLRQLPYCSPDAACEHKELARSVSGSVGAKGGPSTFDAVAAEISACASATRRKRCLTALFAAAVTTQT
jgi:hypothetical protein